MRSVDDLLDRAKDATSSKNDSELAKHLGIRPAAVSNYRRGVSLPNAVVCATLAGLTGEPLARVLGIVGEARAISTDEKAVWRKLAATAMALVIGVGLASPAHVQAAESGGSAAPSIHYAKLRNAPPQLDMALDNLSPTCPPWKIWGTPSRKAEQSTQMF